MNTSKRVTAKIGFYDLSFMNNNANYMLLKAMDEICLIIHINDSPPLTKSLQLIALMKQIYRHKGC